MSRRGLLARPLRLNRDSIAVCPIGTSGLTAASVLNNTILEIGFENVYVPGNEPLLPRTPTNSSAASGLVCAEVEAIPLEIVRRPDTLQKRIGEV